MLLATYYAQNYAGIIGWSLVVGEGGQSGAETNLQIPLGHKQ